MTQQLYNTTDEIRGGPASGERPVSEIVTELWENTEKLARQEIQLALAELDRKVDGVKKDVLAATIGGSIAYAGVLALVAGLILLLSKAIDPWLAAIIVGVVVSGIGFALIQKGKKDLTAENLVPEQTVRSVERSANTFKEAVK